MHRDARQGEGCEEPHGVAEGLTSMTWARSWRRFLSSMRTRRRERRGGERASVPCGAAAGVGGSARWRLGQGFHAARVWGRGGLRRVGQTGHARQLAGGRGLLGHEEGRAGLAERGVQLGFLLFSLFLHFFSFSLFFFQLIQIEFLTECMLHKFTYQTK
jgi:hypothetical protein